MIRAATPKMLNSSLAMISRNSVKSTHQCFSGMLQHDHGHYLLFDPLKLNMSYLEVRSEDVVLKEHVSMIVNEAGESMECTKVWLRPKSVVRRVELVTV